MTAYTTGLITRRRFVRNSAFLGAAVGLTGLLPAGAAAQAAKLGGHLKVGLDGGSSSDSLDPAKAISAVSACINKTWGDTLVTTHPKTLAPLPLLAQEWSPSPDAKVWTFKILEGVKFHDGRPLTVDDVIKTLKRHSDANTQSGAAGILKSIVAIEKSEGNLVITLDGGNADLPQLLADYHLVIQPDGGIGDPNAAIGTGPYKLKGFEPGLRAIFEKNENDWHGDRGFVETVEILTINDATARIAALSSGQVHFVNNVTPKTIPLMMANKSVRLVTTRAGGHFVFIMRCDTSPFDNKDLRLALKYAINRDEMLERILGGHGSVGNDFPINNTYPLFSDDIEQRAYDIEKAAYHYEKSGYKGPLVLHTSDVAFPGAADATVLFQESAKKAGIQIEIKREPNDGYWNNVWNKAPFCASYWGSRATQDQVYSGAYLSTADWNETRFKRPEFDELLVKARGELDVDKRKALYRQMALMVRDDGGTIVPMFNDFLEAAHVSLSGYVNDVGNGLSNYQMTSRVWLNG
jgi:peptide/nickel transport system substrate-binding protein